MIARRLSAAVLFALAALAPGVALSQSGEPYTVRLPDDVWGAKLPLPEDAFGDVSTYDVYVDPRGDVIIPYIFSLPEEAGMMMFGVRFYSLTKDEVLGNWTYGFASSPEDRLDDDEPDTRYEGFVGKYDLKPVVDLEIISVLPRYVGITSADGVPLSGGGRLRRESMGGRCTPPIGRWLVKLDPSGHEMFTRMIIRITEEARPFVINYFCTIMDMRDIGYVHSRSIFPKVFDLGDGGYLVVEAFGPFVIRFDEDWRSPFIDASDELLLVDADYALNLSEQAFRKAWDAQFETDSPETFYLLEYMDAYVTKRFRALIDEEQRAQ